MRPLSSARTSLSKARDLGARVKPTCTKILYGVGFSRVRLPVAATVVNTTHDDEVLMELFLSMVSIKVIR
jgi:hypothetical protein